MALDTPDDHVAEERSVELPASLDALTHAEQSAHLLASLVADRQKAYDEIFLTKTFRYLSTLRRLYGYVRRVARGRRPTPVRAGVPQLAETPIPDVTRSYALWTQLFETFDDRRIQSRLDALAHQPKVSVIFAVGTMQEHEVRASVDSVYRQLYRNWELLVALSASAGPRVRGVLAKYATRDKRIRVVEVDAEAEVAAAVTDTLEGAAGEWVALLDENGRLAPHALALAVLAVAHTPDAALVYSDEDMVDADRRRHSPNFKPEFDPVLLRGQNYVRHFLLLRRELIEATGNLRPARFGRFDWDLVQRVTDILEPRQVVHVPHVLYHSRAEADTSPSPRVLTSARRMRTVGPTTASGCRS